ncbi:AcrR family transcriptional regulator [Sphingobium wenxiniae]|uniref:TetR family transcriptional regulator n=1 Tax=Sphingobium wenxiniae (strain DSM 21828 / CGMCC 1.7748 / JZ-1) TaxID=595605 RepID=A0A562KMV4_SPHWJ|nr:TetR/AcrR family transcriptional regulator [Sphingobium wenxiniae]MBB6191908.1 AcrR family transcriptional regulator [Sphingobium wenxiniae]TWH96667.1 TetR family transcriptional regulator [Sphingobium wenxiniae]
MSIGFKQRRSGRGEATRIAIIEAAEILFAEHGVNGASLRQIGTASGSANTNAVGYHFGNKEALVAAVISHRLPDIEAVRTRMLRGWEESGEPASLRDLLFIMFHPVVQQRNSDGQRSYAAFIGGIFRSGSAWQRYSLGDEYPTTRRIIRMIRDCLAIDPQLFKARMKICTNMIVSSLDLLEKEGIVSEESEGQQFLDAIVMAEAALRAPNIPETGFAHMADW